MKSNKIEKVENALAVVIGILMVFAISLFVCWGCTALWNWLMPMLFHLPVISFWQMYGLIVLISLLFGGLSGSNRK